MALKLEMVDMENNNKFSAEFGMLTPANNYVLPTISIPDGEDEIKFTRSGAQTYSRDYGALSLYPAEPLIAYDMPGYNSFTKWFRIGQNLQIQLQCASNTVRINEIKYKGTSLPKYTSDPSWGLLTMKTADWTTNWKLGWCTVVINDYTYYSLVGYTSAADHLDYTDYTYIFGFDPKAVTDDAFVKPYENAQPETVPGDPNGQGGYGTGLPEGDYIASSDVSGWSFYSLGHGLNAYKVTDAQIGTLSDFLWGKIGNAFDDGSIQGTVEGIWHRYLNYKFNPIAGLISLHRIPGNLTVADGANHDVQLSGITFDGSISVGNVSINAPTISSTAQIKRVETAEIKIDTPYSGFRDFSNTQVKVYIPFCGVVEVDPSCCVGGSIYLIYECDNTTGNLGVQVRAKNIYGYRKNVANVTGNCAIKIPLTGNDNGTGEVLGTISSNVSSALSKNTGGLLTGGLKLATGMVQHNTLVSGQLTGNVGYLTDMTAFVEVSYGIFLDTTTTDSVTGVTEQAYNNLMLRPSFVGGIVGQFTGVSQLLVRANSVSIATESEKAEIERLCREGIRI